MTLSRPPLGVLAAVGPARLSDLHAFSAADLRLVRLRAGVNPATDVLRWREAGAQAFIVQLLCPLPAQSPTSPNRFVEAFTDEIEAFVGLGVTHLEVHDEPNRSDRGAGVTWQDGAAFAMWFLEVKRLLYAQFGDAIQVGFPALASRTQPHLQPLAPMDEKGFLTQCHQALAEADWAALHLFWNSRDDMLGYDGAMHFLSTYLEAFAEQTFAITEFANVNPAVSPEERGAQYAEFMNLASQYEQIWAISGFVLRSSDPLYDPLGWLSPEGRMRDTMREIIQRPRPLDPRLLPLRWPTASRGYTQRFGQNSRRYFSQHGLTGGHNGVDLPVFDDTTAQRAPVRAALRGTVVHVARDHSGYGRHVRIRSYGPRGEEISLLYAHLSAIEVTVGTVMNAGDCIAYIDRPQDGGSPHLHLGMRMKGVRAGATFDGLNPRPYLEAPPRGLPRAPYARTYVLMPPTAEVEWAFAVVRALWGVHPLTLGCQADDAGIGDLDHRRVIAINPGAWGHDLRAFYSTHYPGTAYVPVEAASPQALEAQLYRLPPFPGTALPDPVADRGKPRVPYRRTYVLLPPDSEQDWVFAALQAGWDRQRFTIGNNPDDAGIGDLDYRRIIAVNPEAWGSMQPQDFFAAHYFGVELRTLQAEDPTELDAALPAQLG